MDRALDVTVIVVSSLVARRTTVDQSGDSCSLIVLLPGPVLMRTERHTSRASADTRMQMRARAVAIAVTSSMPTNASATSPVLSALHEAFHAERMDPWDGGCQAPIGSGVT